MITTLSLSRRISGEVRLLELKEIIKGIPKMNPDEFREAHLEQPVLDRWKKELEGSKIEKFRLIEK